MWMAGDATSRYGPLAEILDASGQDGSTGPTARRFGPEAAAPIATMLQDWATQPETATALDPAPMRAHPHYGLPTSLTGLRDGG